MTSGRSRSWFRPKRYGFGSGLPIAWQGWVVLLVYVFVLIGAVAGLPFIFTNPATLLSAITLVFIVASIVLTIICALKTEGGWRWRWGGKP